MSRDFTDRVELVPDDPAPLAAPFTGLRCDAPGCRLHFPGRTDDRALLRQLTQRAEAAGWQSRFVDGVAMHWCPEHVSPDRERLRRCK